MGITIKELSELSGFSIATISRVISGKGSVKEETRKEIEKLLIEHNYRTNAMEIRKKTTDDKTIMIITGDLDNWYLMELTRVLSRYIWKEGYIPMIAYSDNQEEVENEYVRLALLRNYAGIIFMNVRGNERLRETLDHNDCPVVFLNRGIKFSAFDTVCNDNYYGGYRAAAYLIGKGHKRIGFLMGNQYSSAVAERKRGYEDAMRNNGLVVTGNSILVGGADYEDNYKCGEKMIREGLDFTALFCGNYLMTEGLLDALLDYGVRVPEDISIVSFDETPTTRRRKITTVCTDPEKMGKTALKLLMERIRDGSKEASTVYLGTKLRERESVKIIK